MPPPAPINILVVDDDDSIRALIRAQLGPTAYTLTTAQNGRDGLLRFDEGTFDAVITDRQMPVMGGEEFAAQVKMRSPATPIILISGHPPPVMDTSRFNFILAKPFTKEQLMHALIGILES